MLCTSENRRLWARITLHQHPKLGGQRLLYVIPLLEIILPEDRHLSREQNSFSLLKV